MTMTLWQALAIALWAGICGVDLFDGLTHIHRPVVSGLVIGWILHDLPAGLAIGAAFEFIFLGAVPIGGAQPPNVVVGGIVGVAFGILTHQQAGTTIAIALPFAVGMQALITLLFSLFSPFMHLADRYADQANTRGIEWINYIQMIMLFLLYFIIVFLPIYFGAGLAEKVVSALPSRLIKGFSISGGLLPGVGFAILMRIMLTRKEYFMYLFAGFILASYLKLPIIAVAGLMTIFAVYDFITSSRAPSSPDPSGSEGTFSGMTGKEEEEDGI